MELKCLRLEFLLSCSSFFLLSLDPNQNTTPRIHKYSYPKIPFLIHDQIFSSSAFFFSNVFFFSKLDSENPKIFFFLQHFLLLQKRCLLLLQRLPLLQNRGCLLLLQLEQRFASSSSWFCSMELKFKRPEFLMDYLSASSQNLSFKNSSFLKELEMLLCKIVCKMC